jgi:hypothetical protein
MALLAEEIVQEWLNRQGYFTIRGIKIGVDEIDILAIKPLGNSRIECRHFEVQSSMRPVGYVTNVSKAIQKATGRASGSAKERTEEELITGVKEWIEKKFDAKKKMDLMKNLCPSKWSKEFVINVVRSNAEIELMRKQGVTIHHLKDVVSDISKNGGMLQSARGADLTDLILMGIHANDKLR